MLNRHYNDWLTLLIRWFHITVGTAWIGASFYFNWLKNDLVIVLIAFLIISEGVYHSFNIRYESEKYTWVLPIATIIFFIFVWVTKPEPYAVQTLDTSTIYNLADVSNDSMKAPAKVKRTETAENLQNELTSEAFQIIKKRCISCHSATPTTNMFASAPSGSMFDTEQQIMTQADRIFQRTVILKTMPFVNITKMTEEERLLLGKWYKLLPQK